jgi:hypothetical protein
MRPTTKALASISALALLLAGGCDIGQPVIDRAAFVPPPEPPTPPCLRQSTLCSTPPRVMNSAATSRALRASVCDPPDRDAGIDEGDAQANCDEPPPGSSWRNADVLVSAEAPRELVISGVDVFNMRVRLEGPVTLVFRELTQLTNVELVTTSTEATIVFDDLLGVQVTIGDESTPFAGHVAARHSRFDRLSMVAASFEIDSVMITESFVSVDFMNSGDGYFRDVVLDLGDALFAPSRLYQIEIVRCRTLAFFGGNLTETIVPRCESDEPTRLNDAVVDNSVVDGLILGDGSSLHATQLGRYHPSDFVLWRGSVGVSMFCDQALRLKATDNIRCSHCTEAAFGAPQDDACNLERPSEKSGEFKRNLCEPLNLQTECTGPVPDRDRPIADYSF